MLCVFLQKISVNAGPPPATLSAFFTQDETQIVLTNLIKAAQSVFGESSKTPSFQIHNIKSFDSDFGLLESVASLNSTPKNMLFIDDCSQPQQAQFLATFVNAMTDSRASKDVGVFVDNALDEWRDLLSVTGKEPALPSSLDSNIVRIVPVLPTPAL